MEEVTRIVPSETVLIDGLAVASDLVVALDDEVVVVGGGCV